MPEGDVQDVTELLRAWRDGDDDALTRLMPLVYRELKEIACHLMRRERGNHTLETTALVNETYLRLRGIELMSWKDRAHFFAMCARIMRRVLVDHARACGRDKRGAGARRVESSELRKLASEPPPSLVDVHEALHELERHDPQMARVVELRFFGGLDREAIAEVVGISSATVTRRWRTARAWLIGYLHREEA